eukprot:scaffold70444_cov22-Tisochrysis_lutea.AAC.3
MGSMKFYMTLKKQYGPVFKPGIAHSMANRAWLLLRPAMHALSAPHQKGFALGPVMPAGHHRVRVWYGRRPFVVVTDPAVARYVGTKLLNHPNFLK